MYGSSETLGGTLTARRALLPCFLNIRSMAAFSQGPFGPICEDESRRRRRRRRRVVQQVQVIQEVQIRGLDQRFRLSAYVDVNLLSFIKVATLQQTSSSSSIYWHSNLVTSSSTPRHNTQHSVMIVTMMRGFQYRVPCSTVRRFSPPQPLPVRTSV